MVLLTLLIVYVTAVLAASTTTPKPITTTTSKTTTTTSSAPVQTACTARYATISGRQAVFQCNVDHPGGDIASSAASSLDACAATCANNPQCQTAQYKSGFCYLKRSVRSPQHVSGVNSVVFYNATYPNSCPNSAPPSPYLLNGGFEEGLLDETPDTSNGRTVGSFQQTVVTDTVFEGCKALRVVPTSDPNPARQAEYALYYSGITPGQLYNITITVGRPTSAISNYGPNGPPLIELVIEDYLIYSDELCGSYQTRRQVAKGPCPVQGRGGAVGQIGTPQLVLNQPSGNIRVVLVWYEVNEPILVDDIRIVMA